MLAFVVAALLGSMDPQAVPPASLQTEPTDPTYANSPAVRLEDVEVTGQSLDVLIRDFVNEVAAPNRGRGIARWQGSICVGVANLRAEPAQYIVDRVSTVAEDVGLTPGQPGCDPNVIIIATTQPDRVADDLVRQRRMAFRLGGTGMDRGNTALADFVRSDQPVRWWQVSMPVDRDTGRRAIRLPGDCRGDCNGGPQDFAPVIANVTGSRLSTPVVDNLFRTIVVLDMTRVSGVSTEQLADYLAMITLAQIDPTADTSGYATVLNVFADPESAPGLTDWDEAYLAGLYEAERTRKNAGAGRGEIAASIRRAHARLTTADPD